MRRTPDRFPGASWPHARQVLFLVGALLLLGQACGRPTPPRPQDVDPDSEAFLGVHPEPMTAGRDMVAFRLRDVDPEHGPFEEVLGPFAKRTGNSWGVLELTRGKGIWTVLIEGDTGEAMPDLVLLLRRRHSGDRNMLLQVEIGRARVHDQADLVLRYLTEGTDHYIDLLRPFMGHLGVYRQAWQQKILQKPASLDVGGPPLRRQGRILLLCDGIMDCDDFPEDLYARGPADLTDVIWISAEERMERYRVINARTKREIYRATAKNALAVLHWLRVDRPEPRLEAQWRYHRHINWDLSVNDRLRKIYGQEQGKARP